MIRAICLNPAIDRTYYIDGFEAGDKYKTIIRGSARGARGVNVAKVCGQLGEPAAIYGFVGGAAGKRVRGEMERCCRSVRLVEIEGQTRTTINVIDRRRRRGNRDTGGRPPR